MGSICSITSFYPKPRLFWSLLTWGTRKSPNKRSKGRLNKLWVIAEPQERLHIYRGSIGLFGESWWFLKNSQCTYPLFINRAYLKYRYFLSHAGRYAGQNGFPFRHFSGIHNCQKGKFMQSGPRRTEVLIRDQFFCNFVETRTMQIYWTIWKHICFVTGSLWNWIGRNPKGKLSPIIFQGWTCQFSGLFSWKSMGRKHAPNIIH